MMYLLDVNVLLAMHYREHDHYARVKAWSAQLYSERAAGEVVFATCPITELGFVRVASGKAGHSATVEVARSDLRTLKSRESMLFIPDDICTRELPEWVRKSPQTTDGYLLALAKAHDGQLATLDKFVPGAVVIPDDLRGPSEVREEGALSGWKLPLRTSSRSALGDL